MDGPIVNQSAITLGMRTETEGLRLTPQLLLQILLKYRLTLLSFLSCGVIAGAYIAHQPRLFRGVGKLEIRPGSSKRFDLTQLQTGMTETDETLGTDMQVLQSRTLSLQVAHDLNLANSPDFIRSQRSHGPLSLDSAADRDAVMEQFSRAVGVDRLPKTDVIEVTATTSSPSLSASIVNSLMNQYIDSLFQTRYASTRRAADWLTGQLNDLERKVNKDQNRLVELEKRLGLIGLGQSQDLTVTALQGLTQANTQASIERIVSEARYRMLAEMSPSLIEGEPTMLSGAGGQQTPSLLSTLRATQATLQSRLALLKTQFGPNYPEVQQVQAQLEATNQAIDKEQDRVVSEARANMQAAQRNEELTSKKLNTERGTAFAERDDIVEYNILLQNYNSDRQLYAGLLQRLKEAGITSGLESSEVDVIDLADIPVKPAGHSRLTEFLASVLIALAFGILFVIVRELFGSTVQDAHWVEQATGLASFGTLPIMNLKTVRNGEGMGDLVFLDEPQSQFSEALRVLRTSLLLSLPRTNRTVVFTSVLPGEGKSTISSNLAAALAQGGERVLLIDADLRRPRQHRRFNVSNRIGLSTVLSGDSFWRDAVVAIDACPGLSLMPSGVIPPLPVELLASADMKKLLDEVRAEYSTVIIDAPPSSNLADAAILGQIAGATIFVVRYGEAKKRLLVRIIRQAQLNGANLKGFILNAVSQGSSDYYDYYSKGYYADSQESDDEK